MKGLETIIAAAGILMLGYWAVVYSSAGLYQSRENRRFVSEISRIGTRIEGSLPIAYAFFALPLLGRSTVADIPTLQLRRDRSPYAGMTRIRFGGRRQHRPLSSSSELPRGCE